MAAWTWACAAGVILVVGLSGCSTASAPGGRVLRHTMRNIDGEEVELGQYEGQVVLIVNVASRCGFTPQYEGLEALYRKYKDEGFVVLGFPANNFMGQEPGTNLEIKTFCSTKYNVTFPVFAKISVRGKDMAPLYQDLTSTEFNGSFGGGIKWNFTKFLVGRDGVVRARFGSRTKPRDPKVIAAIEAALVEGEP